MCVLTFLAVLSGGGGWCAVGPALLLFFGFYLHLRLLLLSLHWFMLWLYCIWLLLLHHQGFGFIILLHEHNPSWSTSYPTMLRHEPSSDWCITLCLRKVNNHKSNVLFWTCDVSRAGWLVDGICNSNQGIKQKMALCLTCSRHKEASFHLLEITELSCKREHTSIFISVCFFPELLLSSSSFISGLASVPLTSGKACWELSSATEAGVGTLLSILAAAWDNFKKRRKRLYQPSHTVL